MNNKFFCILNFGIAMFFYVVSISKDVLPYAAIPNLAGGFFFFYLWIKQ